MISSKKTKIIATIGPSCEKEETLEKLMALGMDAARLNFSHGSHQEKDRVIKAIRKVEKKLGKHIAIIADIQGPKIRIGNLPESGLELKAGQEISIDTGTREFYENRIPLPSLLFRDGTKEGHIVFLDDGNIHLKITSKYGGIFKAVVLKGGILVSKKGVNVPSIQISSSILNAKDKSDIDFSIKAVVDYIAISFLRNAEDLRQARKFLGKSPVKIIAKIERPEALSNIDEIIGEADAIMIARGDLGIETPLWELPIRQKEIIEKVRSKMKPVIVATQMLDSMIRNPIPTRAEVSDVSNAVYDSTDAVMLSGETASGKFPVEAVEIMGKILESSEKDQDYTISHQNNPSSREVVAHTVTRMASELNAKAIFTGAITGNSAKFISSFRPHTSIIAVTNDETTARQLSLVWGVKPFLAKGKKIKSAKDLLLPAIDEFKKNKVLSKGDKIIYRYHEKLGDSIGANTITIKTID